MVSRHTRRASRRDGAVSSTERRQDRDTRDLDGIVELTRSHHQADSHRRLLHSDQHQHQCIHVLARGKQRQREVQR